MYVAEHYLGLEVEEREVYLDEVKDFAECGLCGTAAVISPVGKIVDHGKEICFPSGMEEMGEITKKLYDTLTGIQMDPYSLLITHQLVSFKRLYVAGIYSPSFLYDRIVGDVYILKAGETIIMPAKKPHAVYGEERFKMLLNVVF